MTPEQLILLNDSVLFVAQSTIELYYNDNNIEESEGYYDIIKDIQQTRKHNINFLWPNHECCSHCELTDHNYHCQHTTEYGCDMRLMG